MNLKKARQLRKEANYHPTQERSYETVNKSRIIKGRDKDGEIIFKTGTLELQDHTSRSLYQQLKKEFYDNN